MECLYCETLRLSRPIFSSVANLGKIAQLGKTGLLSAPPHLVNVLVSGGFMTAKDVRPLPWKAILWLRIARTWFLPEGVDLRIHIALGRF